MSNGQRIYKKKSHSINARQTLRQLNLNLNGFAMPLPYPTLVYVINGCEIGISVWQLAADYYLGEIGEPLPFNHVIHGCDWDE